MLVHTEEIESGEDEIIIRYKFMTKKIQDIIEYVNAKVPPILGSIDHEQYIPIWVMIAFDITMVVYFPMLWICLVIFYKDETKELNQLLKDFKKSSN